MDSSEKTTLIVVGIIAVIAFILITILIVKDNGENKDNSTNKVANSSNTTKEETLDEDFDYVAAAEKQMAEPEAGETIAVMHVKDYGDITFKFFKDKAPKAVENFLTHAKDGYYNGVKFHRVIEEFMIQGGDPLGNGTGGESIWGKGFEEEFDQGLVPYRGALCMASSGVGKSSLGSQFFIVQSHYDENDESMLTYYGYPAGLAETYKKYGGYLSLYQSYTVFGQVIDGMDTVDKIAATETVANSSGEKSSPVNDVVIESIEVKTK